MGSRMKTTLASEGALPDSVGAAHPVDVSVVIPCLNEANSLAYCVDKAMGAFRALYDRLDVRSAGMEFAFEMIIKSAQIAARITEIPILLWPEKRGRDGSSGVNDPSSRTDADLQPMASTFCRG